MWDWVSAAIPETLRGQTLTNVSLVFEGNGFKTYGGYYLYNSQSAESITLSAVSGGYSSTVVLSDSLMPQKRAELEIMTDENGSITFEAAKSAGNMYGYVDEVFLREKFAPEGALAADGEIRGIKITDSEDKLLYGIRPGGEHFISGRLLNTGTTAKAVTLTLTSYAADGTAYASKDKSLSVSAGGAADFSVSVRAKNQAGAYFTLTASQGAKRTVYTITDADLEAQHTDTARAFLKTAAIYNQSGEILDEAVPGEFNMFHITAANPTGAEQGMQGILAVYNSKDRLIDLTSFKCKLVSGVNKYAIGTILPEEEGVYAKLFTWTNLQELKPLIETASFK